MSKIKQNVKKKGFTLVELLVVIAIIGILSGSVVKMSSNSRTKAINSNIQSALSQLGSLAADVDRLKEGGDNNSHNDCSLLFADTDMRRLVNYAAEEAGREVIYTYCSKDSNNYLYTFIAPKVNGEGGYYCVDDTSAVREVQYSNINSILSSYSCSAVATEQEDSGIPVTITSAVYENQTITITFNQNVFYESDGELGYAEVTISDSNGVNHNPNNQTYASQRPYLDGTNSTYLSFSSPILCTVNNNPWGTYSQDSHYINIDSVYGSESNNAASISASITCPAPTGSCIGNIGNISCSGYSNSDSCNNNSVCVWTPNQGACIGFDPVCSTLSSFECIGAEGCTYVSDGGGTCLGNSDISCDDFSGDNCPTQYNCSVYWQ